MFRVTLPGYVRRLADGWRAQERMILAGSGAFLLLVLYLGSALSGHRGEPHFGSHSQGQTDAVMADVPGLPRSVETGSAGKPGCPGGPPSGAALTHVRIMSPGTPLAVYCRGRLLGVATAQPLVVTAEVGATLPLVLHRDGERDRVASLTVSELENDYAY
jgi:hypothetical protein